jgi:hypothetical protein
MPLTSDWAIFSINLSRILSFPYLPTRAGEALIGPVGAITATSLVLVPEQPSMLLGAEVILIGLVMVVAPIVFQARAWRACTDASERYVRAVSSTGFNLAFVVGGVLLFEGARTSLYWIAAGDILGIIAVVLSAWVPMVEILR